ncbi:hypothetical protein GCM10009650_16650 [Nesterenkonia jeotgali]
MPGTLTRCEHLQEVGREEARLEELRLQGALRRIGVALAENGLFEPKQPGPARWLWLTCWHRPARWNGSTQHLQGRRPNRQRSKDRQRTTSPNRNPDRSRNPNRS